MTVFPDVIKIRIIDSDRSKPIPNIGIKIKLFAHHKNDYNLLLPLSDNNGEIEITKDWLEKEIEVDRNLFIMDHSSKLERCQPRFELKILNEQEVNNVVKAMNLFKEASGNEQEKIDRVSKVDNPKYIPLLKTEELQGDDPLEVEMKLKAK